MISHTYHGNGIYIYRTSCHIFLFDATKMASVGGSLSVCLTSHAAKPDVKFHGNHTHTPCAVTYVTMEMRKDVLKSQGSPLCKLNCHVPHANTRVPAMLLQHLFSLTFRIVRSCLYCFLCAPVIWLHVMDIYICNIYTMVGRSIANIYDPRLMSRQGRV